jgi:hypothetical protein
MYRRYVLWNGLAKTTNGFLRLGSRQRHGDWLGNWLGRWCWFGWSRFYLIMGFDLFSGSGIPRFRDGSRWFVL